MKIFLELSRVLCIDAFPSQDSSDTDPAYASKQFKEHSNLCSHIMGAPYNPQGQTIVEQRH